MVKQIFPREPYRLKIHRDAIYTPKPPGDHGFIDNKTPSSYHLSHRVCLDTEELARRSAIYASLADSMVASVIEELSPKDERTKLLREKLTIIQEAQVSAVSAGFAAASNLQLLRRDALLRNFNFQPQVLSAVRTAPFEGYHVVGPEPKVLQARVRAIRQADQMTGSSVTFAKQKEVKTSTKTSSKKTAPRPSVFDRLGSPPSTTQRTVTQEPPFPRKQEVWQVFFFFRNQATLTGPRWGLAWQTLPRTGGVCWATAGPPALSRMGWAFTFQQRPQLTHQSISFRTRNSRQDLQQAVDALLMKGAIEWVTNVKSLGFYSQLFLVPKKTGDLRPVIDLSTLNRHMVVPHFKMETQGSVRSAIRSQEWTVSIDIHDAYLHVPMHQAVRKYLRFVVNKRVYQFTCLLFGLATSPREFTKLLRPVVSLLRQQGVKLHLLRRLADQGRYTGRSSTARPDNHQGPPVSRLHHQLREVRPYTKSRLPVYWDAVQHSTFHSGAPAENACKGPVSSSTLDGQSEHNCQRSAHTSRHAGVHGLAGPARTALSSSNPMVGRHSMVPEDRELVRPDSSSTMGSVRGGMVVIPSSPARSTPRHQGNGSNSLHRCVQFWLGSPVRLTLDTGTVVSISKIVPHKCSGDASCHLCCEKLPTSSEVPCGATTQWR